MTTPPMSTSAPTWVRIGLVALGLPNVAAGLWAVLTPQGWFDDFPGWDPRLVAAEPPFNAHLATDAGAGLLASGVVVLVAAWLADSRSVRLSLIAFAAFAIPHAAWHTRNPSDALTAAQDAQNVVVLLVAAVAPIVLFAFAGGARGPAATGVADDPDGELSA